MRSLIMVPGKLESDFMRSLLKLVAEKNYGQLKGEGRGYYAFGSAYVLVGNFEKATELFRKCASSEFEDQFNEKATNLLFYISLVQSLGWTSSIPLKKMLEEHLRSKCGPANQSQAFLFSDLRNLRSSPCSFGSKRSDLSYCNCLVYILSLYFLSKLYLREVNLSWVLDQFPSGYEKELLIFLREARMLDGWGLEQQSCSRKKALESNIPARSIAETEERLAKKIFLLEFSDIPDTTHGLNAIKEVFHAYVGNFFPPPLVKDDRREWEWRLKSIFQCLEPGSLLILSKASSGCRWFIDGGAHIGYVSRAFASFAGGCELILIEPNAELHDALENNLKGLTYTHYKAVLSKTNEQVPFYKGSGHSNSSVLRGATSQQSAAREIGGVTIDTISRCLKGPGVIKLDLESHEYEALEGGELTLNRDNVCYLVEINPRLLEIKGQDLYAVHHLMEKYDYVGRCVTDEFKLYPEGVILTEETKNYFFARKQWWNSIFSASV